MRWGLIGPGRIAAQFAGALSVVEDSCLHSVAGRNRAKAETFARHHGVGVYHDNHLALLDDPDIDAVYIATPHRSHYELARDCLLAGKPVLCEKPLTVNARETQELIELSRKNGLFLMEALWTRFLPIYDAVNDWLAAGRIGEVASITSSFGFILPRDVDDRMLNHQLAGGALLDMGVYNLAMSQWVFGEQPIGHTIEGVVGETGVDEQVIATLEYANGRHSTFSNSMTQQLENDFTIHGSKGHIRVHPMFWSATRATLYFGSQDVAQYPTASISRNFRATGLEYEIEAAEQCIRSSLTECPRMTHDNSLNTMRLMDALRRDMGLTYDFEDSSE